LVIPEEFYRVMQDQREPAKRIGQGEDDADMGTVNRMFPENSEEPSPQPSSWVQGQGERGDVRLSWRFMSFFAPKLTNPCKSV
jgi:hypothetical protein